MKKKIVKTSNVEKICVLTLILVIAFFAYLGYLHYEERTAEQEENTTNMVDEEK